MWNVDEDLIDWEGIQSALKYDFQDIKFNEIAKEALEVAKELVVYLNFCPPGELMLYYNLIMNNSPYDLISGNNFHRIM